MTQSIQIYETVGAIPVQTTIHTYAHQRNKTKQEKIIQRIMRKGKTVQDKKLWQKEQNQNALLGGADVGMSRNYDKTTDFN